MARADATAPSGIGPHALPLDGLVQALRLSFGMSGDLEDVRDWEAVFRAAVAERCAPLAWIRCGAAIATHAPPEVTAAFRSYFAANSARMASMLAISHVVATALEPQGIRPITLKGPPLAMRLYGESGARVCSDLDWYVPASAQALVYETMLRCGWAHVEGEQGGESCYGRDSHRGPIYLEVHSSLLHPRYSYLPIPPPSGKPMVVDDFPLIVHDDALLVGYLSAHLTTHRFAPLAWLVDLLELWDSLDNGGRKEAAQAAGSAGIGRYLTWAIGRAALLRRASLGDRGAAHSLGLREGWRVEPHPMWRHIALAPSVGNRARAAWTWIAPAHVAGGRKNALRATVGRVAAHWHDAFPVRRDVS